VNFAEHGVVGLEFWTWTQVGLSPIFEDFHLDLDSKAKDLDLNLDLDLRGGTWNWDSELLVPLW